MNKPLTTRLLKCLLLLCLIAGSPALLRADEDKPAADEKPPADATTAKKKVVLIGHKLDHPPRTHMYLPTCELLAKCLRQTPGVEAVVSDGWPKDEKVLEGIDTLVLYSSPGGDMLLDSDFSPKVDELMKEGVGLVAIHWATGLHKKNEKRLGKKYLSYLGGMWIHFVGLIIDDSPLKQRDPKHPICRGWKEYDLHDEFYLNPTFEPTAKPLLQVKTKGQDLIVAWTFDRPNSKNGRSFGTTLGHFHKNFKIEAFRRMMVNGILWTAHVDVPKVGAPVEVSDKDLKLPPQVKAKE